MLIRIKPMKSKITTSSSSTDGTLLSQPLTEKYLPDSLSGFRDPTIISEA